MLIHYAQDHFFSGIHRVQNIQVRVSMRHAESAQKFNVCCVGRQLWVAMNAVYWKRCAISVSNIRLYYSKQSVLTTVSPVHEFN